VDITKAKNHLFLFDWDKNEMSIEEVLNANIDFENVSYVCFKGSQEEMENAFDLLWENYRKYGYANNNHSDGMEPEDFYSGIIYYFDENKDWWIDAREAYKEAVDLYKDMIDKFDKENG
jgi:hypothetical protein